MDIRTRRGNISGCESLRTEVAVTSGMGEVLRVIDGGATGQPDTATANADLDLHELTASLVEAQRTRVFKALQEERASGKGLDQATSVEIKRLMSMIVSSSQLKRPAASQGRAESSGGAVSAVLASLIQRPRKRKS
jgi:hypothetical protein